MYQSPTISQQDYKRAVAKQEMQLLKNKASRVELCRRSFFHYFVYYFQQTIRFPVFAPYHFERFEAIEKGRNIYCEGQRENAKTTILGIAQECRKICYAKCDFICNLCHDKVKATAFNKILATELSVNKFIIQDFGVLFSKKKAHYVTDEFLPDFGISEFTTTNFVKVKAFGIGNAIRGEQYRHPKKGIRRPDFLLCDDIDNYKNTKNTALIDKDVSFLQQEAFGGMASYGQIVVLGNVIRVDGRNVRIKANYRDNPKWKMFSNFIYGTAGTKEGTIQRSRYVETNAESEKLNVGVAPDEGVISLETLKADQKGGYAQNYLGIPEMGSQKFVKAEDILPMKIPKTQVPRKEFFYIMIGIDPAFSKKTSSDAIGIVVTGYHNVKLGDGKTKTNKYVLKSKALEGEDKRQKHFVAEVKAMYQNYHVSRVIIEGNNGGEGLAELLREEGMAVDVVYASKDKVTRFKEQERDLQNGHIYFVEGETEGLISELLDFTGEDGKQDNLVDAFVYSLYKKKFSFRVSGEEGE